jgi:AraC family transcriptional regulator of arabinose operon
MNTDSGITRLLRVTNVYAGSVVYPPGGTFGPRYQQDLQLVLLHTGKMQVDIDDETLAVPRGHVALLHPGRREYFRFAGDTETWHRFITVSVEPLPREAAERFAALPPFLPISDSMNRLTDLAVLLQGERSRGNASLLPVLTQLGAAALELYVSECKLDKDSRMMHPSVLQATRMIQEKYREPLTLQDLADAAGITQGHLIRLFSRAFGMTPIQYLWRYRTERGLDLLRHTGLSVGEIAEWTGFKTSYHFSRSVKDMTGSTPTQIRRASWQAGSPPSP